MAQKPREDDYVDFCESPRSRDPHWTSCPPEAACVRRYGPPVLPELRPVRVSPTYFRRALRMQTRQCFGRGAEALDGPSAPTKPPPAT
jgi:hypothetical protein